MISQRLGRTGLSVSRLCLGTMTFGLQCDEATSHRILDFALDSGITFIDTADVYPLGGDLATAGRTEQVVGSWLAGRRDSVVLATKFAGRVGPNAWDEGGSRRHILQAVEASLRRLGTDYVDIYQMHRPDPNTPIDETLAALDDLVHSGKVRYIGHSNVAAYQLMRALGRSELSGGARFDCVQPRYNLLFRQIERELLPLCVEEQVGVISYNPLAGGLLTGKHSAGGAPAEGTRFAFGQSAGRYRDRYWHDDEFATVARLVDVAAEAGISPAQLAIGWVLAKPVITSAIVGASRPEQLADAVAAAAAPLSSELVALLDELTAPYRRGDATR